MALPTRVEVINKTVVVEITNVPSPIVPSPLTWGEYNEMTWPEWNRITYGRY